MRWMEKNSLRICIAVMAVTLLASIALALHAGPVFRYQDEKDYQQIAANLVHLHTYSLIGQIPTASRPPGYAWFLSIAAFFHVSHTGLRIFNAAALPACQLFLFLLVRNVMSRVAAAIACLLTLLYPVLVYTATVLFPQTIGAALFLCGLWLVLRRRRFSVASALLAGTVWSALILTIPTFLLLMGALLAWLMIWRPPFRARAIYFLLPILVGLGGWSVRNSMAFHDHVFVATNGGINLLLGNSEHVTSSSGSSADVSRYNAVGHLMPEPQADRFYSNSAKLWIRSHPQQAFRLYLAKLGNYFSYFDRTEAEDRSAQLADPQWRKVLMFFTYEPLLLLFLARFALFRRFPVSSEEWCLGGLYLFNALTAAIFFPRIRFRLPLDWLLFAVDAGFLSLLITRHYGPRDASAPHAAASGRSSAERTVLRT